MKAVITGDLIDSTKLPESDFKRVMDRCAEILQTLKDRNVITHYEMYRGDAFQAYLGDAEQGLLGLYKIRTFINSLPSKDNKRGHKVAYNARLGLGVGMMSGKVETLLTNEAPFVLSGRALDELSSENRTVAIKTEQAELNQEFETELMLMEYIMKEWTPISASVIYYKLWGDTEMDIASYLDISQSAVNQHSRKACWNGLRQLIDRYEHITDQLKNKERIKND